MAINKIDYYGKTLIDLTGDTVSDDVVFEGATFHGSDGETKTGTFTIAKEITEQDSLIAQIKMVLAGKAAGGNGLPTQEKSVTIDANGTHEISPDDGFTLSKVGVTVAVPDREIVLQDIEVTENGTYSAAEGYDGIGQVTVNVAGSGGVPYPRDQYQRVEYINTDGVAYLVTDICADNACGMEMVASFPFTQDKACMGSREDGGNTRFFAPYPLSASSTYFGFNDAKRISANISNNTVYRWQVNLLNSRLATVCDMNGANMGSTAISATLTQHTEPIHIFVFKRNDTGTYSSPRDLNLYGARISSGHEVVREYVPCYRKSDGVVGVYEKFTGQFLTAEEGAFTKGADIDW